MELDIVSGFHTDPVGLLLSHRADWAIVSDVEQNDDVLFKSLFSYEMVGICSKDHPLANKEVWQAEDFAEETWVTYPVPDDMLDLYRQVLKPKGINPSASYNRANDSPWNPVSGKSSGYCHCALLGCLALFRKRVCSGTQNYRRRAVQ